MQNGEKIRRKGLPSSSVSLLSSASRGNATHALGSRRIPEGSPEADRGGPAFLLRATSWAPSSDLFVTNGMYFAKTDTDK